MSPKAEPTAVLRPEAIRLGLRATDKFDALRQCGAVLVETGAVEPAYAEAILERERSVSTYMGEGFSIPHGTDASRVHVRRTALAFLQFRDGVDWNGKTCHVCIAIASNSDEHVELLQSLAMVLTEPDSARRLRETGDVDEVLTLLTTPDDEDDD